MTPKHLILMTLLTTTLIKTTSAQSPENSYLKLLHQNYEFYINTNDCKATLNFTTTSYTNAISDAIAKQTERHSGYTGHYNYLTNVLKTQLNTKEKLILFIFINLYVLLLVLASFIINWTFDKLCPCEVTKEPPKPQLQHQIYVHFIPVRNQEPGTHENVNTITRDPPPAYETV